MPKNITNRTRIPKTQSLPELLSAVLNHPDLPDPLHESIRSAVTDLFNSKIDQSEIDAFEQSPTYLSWIINGFHRKQQSEE